VTLTEISARFFLELALGLAVALACTDRRALGAGFTRLMTAFALAALVPAWLLSRAGGAGSIPAAADWLGLGFAAFLLAALALSGRIGTGAEKLLVLGATAAGATSLLLAASAGPGGGGATASPLLLASTAGSALVLGLVTGAMILGHWYLVTPDLPVSHLGRLTKLALLATYAKVALLAATAWLFAERFGDPARSLAALLGIGRGAGASFKNQLDFLWILARVAIGLVGPLVLCHMTLATVRLRATQPATGILYAATVMVLMGELFAFVGGQSFDLVL
jgi:hypothetical protein